VAAIKPISRESRYKTMNNKKIKNSYAFVSILFAAVLLLTSCSVPTAQAPTTEPVTEMPTAVPTIEVVAPTCAPTPAPESCWQDAPTLSLDASGVAANMASQVVNVASSFNFGWWEAILPYTQVTLEGYPNTTNALPPQVFAYAVKNLAISETSINTVQSLENLLQTQQPGEEMPILPMFRSKQMMHAQVSYLEFKGGKGVRYLTQYSNGIVPVNNQDLFYTFQGLTDDGQYYVAAILPVTLPDLPPDTNWNTDQPPTGENYRAYLDEVVNTLNQASADLFTPDLSKLDAMMQSSEVNQQ
jgi:hypothetical protein